MCPSKTSKESRIDPFLHGKEKFHVEVKPLPFNYYKKVEQDVMAASTMMKEGTERAKECSYPLCNCPFDMGAGGKCARGLERARRIDIIGQNGGDGAHYEEVESNDK